MTTRSRITFLFYIKRTKLLNNGEAPIYVKINVGKQNVELSILKCINPKLWSTVKKGAIGNTKEAQEINNYIDHVRQQLNGFIVAIREEGREITAKAIKNAFIGINPDEKHIAAIFAEHNREVALLVGKDFAARTLQRYETCLLHLRSYIKAKYQKDDLPLSYLDPDFIRGYELYFKTERNCCHNTTMKYIKNFKKIVRICLGNGWLKQDPFINYKLKLNKVERDFLSEEEINKIMKKQFSCNRLQLIADVFLFGCYTGYAYADLKRLTLANVVKDEKGQLWIHARRLKTDMVSHVPMLPPVQRIIKKYSNHKYCITNNVLLPVPSNQKLNTYLKEIADLCGIKKNLSSHVARHTFATTVTLNNDIPIESVSKMLGHSTITMTQNYAKMLDKKVAKDMSKLMDKFNNKPDTPIALLTPCQN